jgi:TPR repeat protein
VNYYQAFLCFEKASESNDTKAIYNLGICYTYGYGTEIDDKKALECFKIIESTNADAQAYIGYFLYQGWGGLNINKKDANEYFILSQNKGSIISLYLQAKCYIFDTDLDNRYEKTIGLCNEAINLGYEQANGILGFYYYNEDSPETDVKKAYSYFLLGEKVEDDVALYGLGCCYENGNGVVKNINEAMKYYQASAKKGNMYANYCLGVLYSNENYCNYEDAFKCYYNAANRGHIEAMNQVGIHYDLGLGCDENQGEAFNWFEKAANLGNIQAKFKLATFYYNGLIVKKDLERAFSLFLQSSEAGDYQSQYYLGVCYKNGYGVEMDLNKAIFWYEKAAQIEGYSMAQNDLGWLFYYQNNYRDAINYPGASTQVL